MAPSGFVQESSVRQRQPQTLPHPACSRRWPGNTLGDALGDTLSRPLLTLAHVLARGQRMVARGADFGAGDLVACASGHPLQRRQRHPQCEGGLCLLVVARGSHQRLRIDR